MSSAQWEKKIFRRLKDFLTSIKYKMLQNNLQLLGIIIGLHDTPKLAESVSRTFCQIKH